jgi:hypothetical protein
MPKGKRRESGPPRAAGWTAYTRYYGRGAGEPTFVIRADGEIAPMGFGESRPATQKEITEEVARRVERDTLAQRISEFRARADWQDADDIRSAIECMEYNNHPLDRLTPEEWRTFRDRICGPRTH